MTGGNDPALYKTNKDGLILGFDLEMLKRKHAEEEAEAKKELGLNPKTDKPLPQAPTPPVAKVDNEVVDENKPVAEDEEAEADTPQSDQKNLSDDDFNEMWGEQ